MTLMIPPLPGLRHFEAAARLGSFKAAAAELHLTQAAISLQIRALERFLSVRLFDRGVRKVALTREGRRLAEVLSRAFLDLSQVCRELSGQAAPRAVRVEVGPFFSARWLAPRLGRFIRRHPEINVHLNHMIGVHGVQGEIDLSLRWGRGAWKGFEASRLLEVSLQPVCQPGLVAKARALLAGGRPGALPLLHSQTRRDWRSWLAAAGLPVELAESGTVLDEANVVVEAAVSGAGVAIGFFPIMDEDLRSGRLVPAHPHRQRSEEAYYLLRSRAALGAQPVETFCAWLREECAAPQRS